MKPQLQCPNCNQFELGFTHYGKIVSVDHQRQPKKDIAPVPPTQITRCGSFDCGYTGKVEEFIPS